jgi:hypothetical protein
MVHKIMAADLPFKVVSMELPDVEDNSPFNTLYERMVNEIGYAYFRALLIEQVQAEPKWLDTVSPSDIKKALRQLALNDEVAEAAWDFLCGRKLGKDERARVGVSKVQLDDSEEYAGVIRSISQVISARTPDRRILLFVIDEGEGLKRITKANAFGKWVQALRKTLDIKEVGAIFAVGAQEGLQGLPAILKEDGAIVRRFGQQNYIVLEQYDTNETKSFLSELFAKFVDPAKRASLEAKEALASKPGYDPTLYPFMADAFEGYCRYLVSEQALAKPAEFLTKLHATLGAALRDGRPIIDRAFLEDRSEWE